MESLTGKVAKRFYLKDNQGPRGPVTKLHLAEHKMTTLFPPPPILRWDTSPSQTTPSLPYFLKVFFFRFIPTVPFVVSLCFTPVHHPLGTRDKEI